jgi:methylmalonyl-CoA/ethylmalonyl-CoA epimerase
MTLPERYGLSFHHLGLASRREQDSVKFLEGLGYAIGKRIKDPLQNVWLRLCSCDAMPDVEIVIPTENAGPLDSILNNAETDLYHHCYETGDLELSLQAMKDHGIRVICVSPPMPAVLFGGRMVSFYSVRGFGLIELLEST